MKRIVSVFLALLLLLSIPSGVFAEKSSDVSPTLTGSSADNKGSKSEDSDAEWIEAVEAYAKSFDYDNALKTLQPYLEDYPAARAFEALLYSQMESKNGEDLYRYKYALLVADGEDPQALLDYVTKKIYGFTVALDFGGMAYNTYTRGDYVSAAELYYYLAKTGDRNAKETLCFAMLDNPVFISNLPTLPNKETIREAIQQYYIELGENESDPVAMYITADAINSYGEFLDLPKVEPVELYKKAASLFSKIISDGKLEEDSEEVDLMMSLTTYYTHSRLDTNNPLVCYYIGECYEYGDPPISTNYDEAAKWYKKSADIGLPEGAFNYSYCLLTGRAEGTYEDCVNYLYQAADAKNAMASYYWGVLLLHMGLNDEAEEYMKFAADAGHKYATVFIQQKTLVVESEIRDQIQKWIDEASEN